MACPERSITENRLSRACQRSKKVLHFLGHRYRIVQSLRNFRFQHLTESAAEAMHGDSQRSFADPKGASSRPVVPMRSIAGKPRLESGESFRLSRHGVFPRERRGCPIDDRERPLTVEKLVRREFMALGQRDAGSGISAGVERNGDRSASSLLAQTALSLMGQEVFERAAKVVAEASQRRIGPLKGGLLQELLKKLMREIPCGLVRKCFVADKCHHRAIVGRAQVAESLPPHRAMSGGISDESPASGVEGHRKTPSLR